MKKLFLTTLSFLLLISANSYAKKHKSVKENKNATSVEQPANMDFQKSKTATKKIAKKKPTKKGGVQKATKKEDKSNI